MSENTPAAPSTTPVRTLQGAVALFRHAVAGPLARRLATALLAGSLSALAMGGLFAARGADEKPAAGATTAGAAHGKAFAELGQLTPFAPEGYVGSTACAACHKAETTSWSTSHHALAMAPATPESVLGDFSGVTVTQDDAHGRFFREGDRYMVETEGKDGKPATFQVSDTFGWTPLQQYLVTFPDGRRQVLPWAWDTRPKAEGGQRWFHVYEQTPKPGDSIHWTGVLQTWNHMCAECHSTALEKGYDLSKDTYATTFSEVSIGCESCHGPGAGHVAWAAKAPRPEDKLKGFEAAFAPRKPIDFTPDPKTGSPKVSDPAAARPPGDEVELCARCHSRRGLLSEHWKPGQPLADTHSESFLTQGLFEADGQMRDEVFNDQAFKQSKMYAKGVVCSDCHDPHSGHLKAEGAQVCSQCHLPERFAAESHTGHKPGPGAPDCISCHMPARTYMRVDVRHDHSFRIPRPDLSESLGTPNTCNACHADKSAEWAAVAIARWHGPERKGFQTYGQAFRDARRGDAAARAKLIAIANDPAVPGVARATAVDALAAYPSRAGSAAVEGALKDADPLVRVAALRALIGAPVAERWRLAGPLLEDPVLAVRLAAARDVADVPPDALPPADAKRLTAALAAYEEALRVDADRPEGRANRATYFLMRRDPAAAERELEAGLKLEPGAAGLAVNLADIYRNTGREAEAERLLRDTLAVTFDPAPLHHALGLSLVRQKRSQEALAELEEAVRLASDNARFAYVLAVALQSLGDQAQSQKVLAEALKRNPNDVDLLGLALNAALNRRDLAAASADAERLSTLRPDDQSLAGLLARLRGAQKR